MEKIGSFIKSYFERFIERKRLELGEENIERLISLGEKIEDEQKAIRKNEGSFRWIVWILVAANIVSLTYWFEFEGFFDWSAIVNSLNYFCEEPTINILRDSYPSWASL